MQAPPSPPSRRLLTVVAVCLGALALGACGEKMLDTGQVESTISRQFAAQGTKVHDVSCQGGIKAKVGAKVSCTALNPAETKLILAGRVTSVHGGRGRFRVRAVRGIAKGSVVAAQARRLIEAKVGQKAAAFTCPSEVPIPTRPSVRCILTAKDGTRFAATVTAGAGSRMSVKVAKTPLK